LPALHGSRSSSAVRSLHMSLCTYTPPCLLHTRPLGSYVEVMHWCDSNLDSGAPCQTFQLATDNQCTWRQATGVCRMKKDTHPDFYEEAKVGLHSQSVGWSCFAKACSAKGATGPWATMFWGCHTQTVAGTSPTCDHSISVVALEVTLHH
jgi:hypothetical protein